MPFSQPAAAVSSALHAQEPGEPPCLKPVPAENEKNPEMSLPGQSWVKKQYSSAKTQIFVAILIFGNFAVSALEAQLRPEDGSSAAAPFKVCEWFFGIIFLLELLVNIYGSWFCEFWKDTWNWFDFFIVLISVLSLTMENLPGISVLRLFRAFRVFRLFKRVKNLRFVIEACGRSVPGVANVFAILGIIMAIWAIMGVDFFGKPEEEADYDRSYFDSFFPAMFTLFQVWSGDGWCSVIARPVVLVEGMVGGMFFISFFFVNGMIMANAVVAVLCNGFMDATKDADDTQDLPSVTEMEPQKGLEPDSWDALDDTEDGQLDTGNGTAGSSHVDREAMDSLDIDPEALRAPVEEVLLRVQKNVWTEFQAAKEQLLAVRELAKNLALLRKGALEENGGGCPTNGEAHTERCPNRLTQACPQELSRSSLTAVRLSPLPETPSKSPRPTSETSVEVIPTLRRIFADEQGEEEEKEEEARQLPGAPLC